MITPLKEGFAHVCVCVCVNRERVKSVSDHPAPPPPPYLHLILHLRTLSSLTKSLHSFFRSSVFPHFVLEVPAVLIVLQKQWKTCNIYTAAYATPRHRLHSQEDKIRCSLRMGGASSCSFQGRIFGALQAVSKSKMAGVSYDGQVRVKNLNSQGYHGGTEV